MIEYNRNHLPREKPKACSAKSDLRKAVSLILLSILILFMIGIIQKILF